MLTEPTLSQTLFKSTLRPLDKIMVNISDDIGGRAYLEIDVNIRVEVVEYKLFKDDLQRIK